MVDSSFVRENGRTVIGVNTIISEEIKNSDGSVTLKRFRAIT